MINKLRPRPTMEGLLPGMCAAAEPDVLEKVMKFCVDRADVPIIPKFLSYEECSPYSAQAAQRAGAKGINLGDCSSVASLTINVEDATVGDEPTHPHLVRQAGGRG